MGIALYIFFPNQTIDSYMYVESSATSRTVMRRLHDLDIYIYIYIYTYIYIYMYIYIHLMLGSVGFTFLEAVRSCTIKL